MDELLPILEREGITLSVEPHPEDWLEQLQPAMDIVGNMASKALRLSYIAPHTFHYGGDMAAMLREAAPLLAHVRVADTFDHRKSSQLRYIVNPPGSHHIRVHQHLDMGDRKSTRLNSSHLVISYAVFCLKKKKTQYTNTS